MLGPAAVVYGSSVRARRTGGRAAGFAVAVGTLATVAAIIVLVWDTVA